MAEQTQDELKRDNTNLKRQLEVAMQQLSILQEDELDKEGYYALKGYVKQQIDIVKKFKLDEEISKNPKDDKFYDRVKAIGEGLKSMITDLKGLKVELKISPDEEKEEYLKRKKVITAENMADNIGELAGRK